MTQTEIVVGVVSWLAGIVAAIVVQQILNRRALLSYTVHHHRVGTTAEDRTFGTVQITWNGAPVPNLYLSTVELRNESTRDLQAVRVKAYTGDTTLLSEFPVLVGTTQPLRYSPEYEGHLAVQAGGQPSELQREKYGHEREYIAPVFNRGQEIRLQYVNTSKSAEQPTIWLEVIHPGVSLRFQGPRAVVYGVPQQWAVISGILLGILFATLLAAYSPSVWITAFAALVFGLFAQAPGAFVIRATKWLRQHLAG